MQGLKAIDFSLKISNLLDELTSDGQKEGNIYSQKGNNVFMVVSDVFGEPTGLLRRVKSILENKISVCQTNGSVGSGSIG